MERLIEKQRKELEEFRRLNPVRPPDFIAEGYNFPENIDTYNLKHNDRLIFDRNRDEDDDEQETKYVIKIWEIDE